MNLSYVVTDFSRENLVISKIRRFVHNMNRVKGWDFRTDLFSNFSIAFDEDYGYDGKIIGLLGFSKTREQERIYFANMENYTGIRNENTFCKLVKNQWILDCAYVHKNYRKTGIAKNLFLNAKDKLCFDEKNLIFSSPFSFAGKMFIRSIVGNDTFYYT